jgi:hypothetical protein
MFNVNEIKPHMPVVCSRGGQFAVVDHVEGTSAIKLTKDESGQHHYIPMSWVRSVDTKVHVDRPGDQAMEEWSTAPPENGGASANEGRASGVHEKNGAPADPFHAERVRSQQQQEGVEHPEQDPGRLRTKN